MSRAALDAGVRVTMAAGAGSSPSTCKTSSSSLLIDLACCTARRSRMVPSSALRFSPCRFGSTSPLSSELVHFSRQPPMSAREPSKLLPTTRRDRPTNPERNTEMQGMATFQRHPIGQRANAMLMPRAVQCSAVLNCDVPCRDCAL
eukprot:7396696-Pyramimonas_sp.AAC.1